MAALPAQAAAEARLAGLDDQDNTKRWNKTSKSWKICDRIYHGATMQSVGTGTAAGGEKNKTISIL